MYIIGIAYAGDLDTTMSGSSERDSFQLIRLTAWMKAGGVLDPVNK